MNILEQIKTAKVEWRMLGEVANIQRGASPRPISQYITDDDNGIPWIKIGDIAPNAKYVNQTAQRITKEGALKSRLLKKGDFIISNSMSYGRPYILKIDEAIHDGWASISDFERCLNSDFLYYYLSSNIVQNYWKTKINSGSVSNLNSEIIKKLIIPIPPLSLQQELQKELQLRQKQYHYYRDLLLTFDNNELNSLATER